MTNTTDTSVERGSGNVFADLGLPDPDGHLLKAELVGRIDDIVREHGIPPSETARLLDLSWHDVDIVIRPPRSAGGGKLRIASAESA